MPEYILNIKPIAEDLRSTLNNSFPRSAGLRGTSKRSVAKRIALELIPLIEENLIESEEEDEDEED